MVATTSAGTSIIASIPNTAIADQDRNAVRKQTLPGASTKSITSKEMKSAMGVDT
jgi:hypothetical protein